MLDCSCSSARARVVLYVLCGTEQQWHSKLVWTTTHCCKSYQLLRGCHCCFVCSACCCCYRAMSHTVPQACAVLYCCACPYCMLYGSNIRCSALCSTMMHRTGLCHRGVRRRRRFHNKACKCPKKYDCALLYCEIRHNEAISFVPVLYYEYPCYIRLLCLTLCCSDYCPVLQRTLNTWWRCSLLLLYAVTTIRTIMLPGIL